MSLMDKVRAIATQNDPGKGITAGWISRDKAPLRPGYDEVTLFVGVCASVEVPRGADATGVLVSAIRAEVYADVAAKLEQYMSNYEMHPDGRQQLEDVLEMMR